MDDVVEGFISVFRPVLVQISIAVALVSGLFAWFSGTVGWGTTAAVFALIGLCACFGIGAYVMYLLISIVSVIARERREKIDAEVQRANAEYEAAAAHSRFPELLRERIKQDILERQLPMPPLSVTERTGSALSQIYQPGAEEPLIRISLMIVRKLPAYDSSPFLQPFVNLTDAPSLIYDIMKELRSFNSPIVATFNENVVRITMEQTKGKGGNLVYPQHYKGDRADIPSLYLKDTPLADLFSIGVPFPLHDGTRYEGHFIVGERGRGKTNFLLHLVGADVDRIPDISVVVIDSQRDRLMHTLERITKVDPIIIGPKRPVPLNPFYLGNTDDTLDVLMYVLGGISNTEFTPIQATAVKFVIRAVAHHERPTVDMVEDFFNNPNQALIKKADQATRDYLSSDTFKKLPPNTKDGIMGRLAIFKENEQLRTMLNAPGCLDLPKELQAGRLILVDTDKGTMMEDRTRAFGRLFIGYLHLAMRKRIGKDGSKKPIMVHIDELPDYCPPEQDDPKLRQLLDQARKQNFALTLCSQRDDTTQLNQKLLGSLNDCSLKSRAVRWYKDRRCGDVDVTIYGDTTHLKDVPWYMPPLLIGEEELRKRYAPVIQDNTPEPPPPLPRSV